MHVLYTGLVFGLSLGTMGFILGCILGFLETIR